MQGKALRVKVTAFLPNPQGCSKILQLELTGMTCAVWACKGLIPPTLVSQPQKVILFGGCSASPCSWCRGNPLGGIWERQDVLLDHTGILFGRVPIPRQ